MRALRSTLILLNSLERFFEFILIVLFSHLLRHNLEEFIEFNHAIVILINVKDHLSEFSFCWKVFFFCSLERAENRKWKVKKRGNLLKKFKLRVEFVQSKFSLSPEGRCPIERITTPNSAIVMEPSSSLS